MNKPPSFPPEIAKAVKAGRVWTPDGIGELRASRSLGIEDTVKAFRFYADKLGTGDTKTLPRDLIALVRMMTDRLNWLANAGKLGDAPRGFETWPINYAPDVSKGAGKWEAADDLYRSLGCGKEGFIPRGASRVSYGDQWTKLVVDSLRAAWLARLYHSWVTEQKAKATAAHHVELRHGASILVCDYYLCGDGQVIEWPGWAEGCRDLPDKLTGKNHVMFLPIVRELVRLYLLVNEGAMRELQQAIEGQNASREWNATTVNHGVMRRVKDALVSLANK